MQKRLKYTKQYVNLTLKSVNPYRLWTSVKINTDSVDLKLVNLLCSWITNIVRKHTLHGQKYVDTNVPS